MFKKKYKPIEAKSKPKIVDDIWETHYTQLWIVEENQDAFYGYCVAVNKIEIIPDDLDKWICGYCNSTIQNSSFCLRCNAPRKSRKRKGNLHVYGYLPKARKLDDLKDRFSLEVHHGNYCDPTWYEKEHIILIASNCTVSKKWISELVSIRMDNACIVQLDLIIDAEISLRFQDDN